MRNTALHGVLEIDHDRGVIYFHLKGKKESLRRGVATALRICQLPRPIPQIMDGTTLDITHMVNCNWRVPRCPETCPAAFDLTCVTHRPKQSAL